MADRLMVHALKLAAGYDDISVVAKGMEQMLNTPGVVDLHRLMRFLGGCRQSATAQPEQL